MTLVLLSAVLAVLLWPDRRTEGFRRAVRLTAAQVPDHGLRQLPVLPVAVAGSVAIAAASSTPLVALLAGAVALVAARTWSAARRARTGEERLAGLAEGLGAVTAELRSGRSLEAAATAAVAACGDAASGDLLARAVRMPEPVPRSRSTTGADDMGDDDRHSDDGNSDDDHGHSDDMVRVALCRISAAVVLSTRTGCSLADVLTAVHGDLRARGAHRQELRAAISAPQASAMLLAGLPLLGLAMGSGVGADPWQVLTGTGTGQVLLVTGVVLELAGLAWARRLVGRVLR